MSVLTIFLVVILSQSSFASSDIPDGWLGFEGDWRYIKKANKSAMRDKWTEVSVFNKRISDKTARNIFLWREFSTGHEKIRFSDITTFINENPHWPNIKKLRIIAENSIDQFTPKEQIIKWFTKSKSANNNIKINIPLTTKGKEFLADAMERFSGKYHFKVTEVNKLIRQSWIEGSFSVKEEGIFLSKYGKKLSNKDHINRIENLLWQGSLHEARRIISKVDENHQHLFKARISLQKFNSNLSRIIESVPFFLRNNEGLIYDRVMWREKKGKKQGVIELLKIAPTQVKYPAKWWKIRYKYSRYLLDKKDYFASYDIISHHGFKDNIVKFAKAEWLAGWIAYNHTKKYHRAYKHFYNMYQKVSTPISLGRASYWAAMAAQRNNNPDIARKWFKVASNYQTSFYGQIAALKLGHKTLSISTPQKPSSKEIKSYENNDILKATYILNKLGRHGLATTFLAHAIKTSQTSSQQLLISNLGEILGRPDYGILAAKAAARNKGAILTQAYYPVIKNLTDHKGRAITSPEKALIHAIILQESMFKQDVKSPAGALGLMQIMPATAKEFARNKGMKYHVNYLTSKPKFNIRIGSGYLQQMIKKFDGSYILAVAAYNGGATNVRRWIKRFGDPRKAKNIEEIIHWIEAIPFPETQSYVHRAMENLQLYRYMINKDKAPMIRTLEDISR